jgi:RNA polymerase sigma factor (sigma-70 family)
MFVRRRIDRRFASFTRTGDPEALAAVFDATAGQLLRVALWLTRQRADADDLLQRTFPQAIELRERFDAGKPVLPWLMGLMANQAHKLRRERERRAVALPVVERAIDPVAEAVAGELQEAVRAVRAALSEPYRDVLALHLEQGLNAGEIAARLGRPAGTVRTQLMRALQLLRKRLPGGFVAGMVATPTQEPGALATVKATVVAAARRSAPPAAVSSGSAAVVAFGGMLVAKKLLIVVPLLALLAGVVVQQRWWRTPQEVAAPPAPMSAVVDTRRAPSSPSKAASVERHQVLAAASPDSALPPFDPSPVHVAPWIAHFHVVDIDLEPVADAVVTIWMAKKMPAGAVPPMARNASGRGYTYQGHGGEPLFKVRTDATGHVEQRLDLECVVAAAGKQGLDDSSEQYLHGDDSAREIRFELDVPVALHGFVLGADGLPAAGTRVTAGVGGYHRISRADPPAPGPVTTGIDGRFGLPVRKAARYSLFGERDGRRTFTEHVRIHDDHPPEVVLSFPGAITIEGFVVDPEGRPVGGASVTAWREFHSGGSMDPVDDAERERADTAANGRFSIPVARHARYQLIANKPGLASNAPVWVETTAVRPHTETQLELQAFAAIKGHVVHGDGSPFVGISVGARPEKGAPYGMGMDAVPDQENLFGRVRSAITGDDGSIALVVHPGTRWTVEATRDHPVGKVQLSGIEPGRTDVLLRVTDADLRGCVVHGTVVRTDGGPVGPYRVEIIGVERERGQPETMGDAGAHIDGAHFTVGPLPLGKHCSLLVTAKDNAAGGASHTVSLAPAHVGPFTTDQPQLDLGEFRLEPWGEVPVRLLDAQGLPAKKMLVVVRRDVYVGDFFPPQRPDSAGRAVVKRCTPGASHLYVAADEEFGARPVALFEQELVVTPGLNPEVVVRLPASSKNR